MKTSFTLLAIAAALAACLWTSSAMAQAGTMPAGIGTQGMGQLPAMGERPGTGERPDTGERPGRGERPATAQPAAVLPVNSAAALRQQALSAMESLREEIATLSALKHAQAALLALNRLAWHRAGSEAGEAPATLAAALCAEPALGAWCALLPATFGTSSREDGHDRN